MQIPVPTNRTADEILSLLAEGAEIGVRELLVLIANMNRNLIANTDLTRDVAERLEAHTQEVKAKLQEAKDKDKVFEDKLEKHEKVVLINRAIGGWRVLAVIGMAMVGMSGYILNGYLNAMLKEVGRNDVQEQRLGSVETTVKVIEANISNATGMLLDLTQCMNEREREERRERQKR